MNHFNFIDQLKQKVAVEALQYLTQYSIIGVGSGSTIKHFISALSTIKHHLEGCVASSIATAQSLKEVGIPVLDLSMAEPLAVYVDGADEVTSSGLMIKGGGAALTREKILACSAKQFICLVDETKLVERLGAFPIAVEVIPMARSLVGREIVKLGGQPVYREQCITDNGNIILDVHGLLLTEPLEMEFALKQIPGVVECGLFIRRKADLILVANNEGVLTY